MRFIIPYYPVISVTCNIEIKIETEKHDKALGNYNAIRKTCVVTR